MSLKEATLIIAVLDLLANIPLVVQFGWGLAVMVQGRINHPEGPDSGAFFSFGNMGINYVVNSSEALSGKLLFIHTCYHTIQGPLSSMQSGLLDPSPVPSSQPASSTVLER